MKGTDHDESSSEPHTCDFTGRSNRGSSPGKNDQWPNYLKALQSGELPLSPFAAFMGMWITEVSEGQIVMAVEPSESHYNHEGGKR